MVNIMDAINLAIDAVLDAELSVIEHENNCDFSSGTAYSNPVKGKYKQTTIKKAGIKRAIKLAKSGH